MSDILEQKERVARKEHRCDYCFEIINKGEKYEWAKLVDDCQLYEWKNHIKCGFIARELWSFIDPDNGMTENDFKEGLSEFCNAFICPSCKEKDEECYYCIDKAYDFLQTHELTLTKDKRCGWVWKCIPKVAVQDESSNISM